MLRKRYPEKFDTVPDGEKELHQPTFFLDTDGPERAEHVLGNMLWLERFLVYAAYAGVKKLAVKEASIFRLANFRKELVGLYMEIGIAKGAKHAKELIRDIERMGREAANPIGR